MGKIIPVSNPHSARFAEEKPKKSMIDAARLPDELRAEQENPQMAERARREGLRDVSRS